MKQPINIKEQYPKIAAMTVAEVVETQDFAEAFKKVLNNFNPHANKNYYAYKSLLKEGFFDLTKFREEYIKCIDKQSDLPFAKRVIIFLIGNNAYSKTIEKMMDNYETE